MMAADIIYIMAGIVFFGVCFLFAKVCDTFSHSNERGGETEITAKKIS
jgi:hypothetical protein